LFFGPPLAPPGAPGLAAPLDLAERPGAPALSQARLLTPLSGPRAGRARRWPCLGQGYLSVAI